MEKDYVAYEYSSVSTKGGYLSEIYSDNMPCFGWSIVEKNNGIDGVTLKFKRNAEIKNKAELNEKQRAFEVEAETVARLEKEKTRLANTAGWGIGAVGTVFMGGATFAYLAGLVGVMIPLAVVGFAGWIAPYFVYRKIKQNSTRKAEDSLKTTYQKIYKICKDAQQLL